MTVTTVTHLNFRGEARAALEFYRSVSGGELTIITYGEMGATPDGADPEEVVWGQVRGPASGLSLPRATTEQRRATVTRRARGRGPWRGRHTGTWRDNARSPGRLLVWPRVPTNPVTFVTFFFTEAVARTTAGVVLF